MSEVDTQLSLSYAAFGQLWKQLISRRKARKLKLDKDTVWAQLLQKGSLAQFAPTASSLDSINEASSRADSKRSEAVMPKAKTTAGTRKPAPTKAKTQPAVKKRTATKKTSAPKETGASATPRKRTVKSTRR